MVGRCLIFVSVVLVLPIGMAAQEKLSGRVSTLSGEPVKGAYVASKASCCPIKNSETKTDEEGRFELSDPGAVVYVQKEGFHPFSHLLIPGEKRIEVVLRNTSVADRRTALCPAGKEPGRRVGSSFRFLLPKNAKVKKGYDLDHAHWRVYAPNEKVPLVILSGSSVIRHPHFGNAEWLVRSSSFQERWNRGGHDIRGEFKTGKEWRHLAMPWDEAAYYNGVSEQAADYYDRIMDSVCLAAGPNP